MTVWFRQIVCAWWCEWEVCLSSDVTCSIDITVLASQLRWSQPCRAEVSQVAKRVKGSLLYKGSGILPYRHEFYKVQNRSFIFSWHSESLFAPALPNLHFISCDISKAYVHFSQKNVSAFVVVEILMLSFPFSWRRKRLDIFGALHGRLAAPPGRAPGWRQEAVAAATERVAGRRNPAADGWKSPRLPLW